MIVSKLGGGWILAVAMTLSPGLVQAQPPALERGAEMLLPFKRDLQEALKAGLADGPLHAIGVCRLQAPAIAAELSRDGVRVGRTSHRLRNPANAAPGWVRPVLDAYLAEGDDREPRVIPLPDRQVGYVEPILLQPLCLTCHGPTLPDALAARIDELYPDDQAVGFEVGELRGVFWIEFPVEPR